MNKYIFLIILSTVLYKKNFSQNIKVLSQEDKQPIPYAHITIQDKTLKSEKTYVANALGSILITDFENSKTKLSITISFIGYKKLTDSLLTTESKTYYLTPEKTTLNEVVVTAQYAPNSLEKAVHKIKVIDSKKIEAMGAVNLKDVLTNELNVRLSQDNIFGSSMSLQGISGQNVKILIDGIPVTGRMNGSIDISQINMDNTERIEIIEGPLSVNYGTDALGGTINIITKKSQKETFSINSNSYYESNGQYNSTGKIGYKKKKNLLSISGGRNYFDGWRNDDKPFYIEKTRIADSLRFRDWKPKEQYFGTLYYGHYFKKIKAAYTGDYFYEQVTNKGLPRLPYYETAIDDYYNTNRINNAASLNGQINKNYFLNFLTAYNHFQRVKNTFFKDLTTLKEILTQNASDQDTSTFNDFISRGTISTAKDSNKLNYELGYDINHETALGIRVKNSKQKIGDYALFFSAEYKPFSFLTIRPGLRAIYNTAYKAPLIPSVNVKFSNSIKEDNNKILAVRFSYARGFRSPSLKELYFYFVDINHNIEGNENLKAEQSHNLNFSTSYSKIINERIWKIDLSFFYNNINNMISLAQASATRYSYFNIDKYQTLGTQLQSEYAIKHLKITLGGAYVGRYNQLSEQYSAEQFSYSPEAKCNLFYEWHKQSTTFGLFYKYVGELPSYALSPANIVYKTTVQDYHTADASITKMFFEKKIGLTIGAKNLFNVKNITGVAAESAHSSSSSSIPVGMGRTYFFKLHININSKN